MESEIATCKRLKARAICGLSQGERQRRAIQDLAQLGEGQHACV